MNGEFPANAPTASWEAWLRRGTGTAWNLLFPPTCPLCQAPLAEPHRLCPPCLSTLPPLPEDLCPRCGFQSGGSEPCPRCGRNPKRFPDAFLSPFIYQEGMEKLLVGLKFSDKTTLARLIGGLCWERMAPALRWEEPELVTPVPLHPWRLIQRRYNQAALLAEELARRLERPLECHALRRVRKTPPQTRLGAKERMRNLEGAFAADPRPFRDRTVLLVDDVSTTGATLAAATQALKEAGAARVVAFCAARALKWN